MNLVEQVRRAEVIGAGGGGFPTHAKLSARADTIIANSASITLLQVRLATSRDGKAFCTLTGDVDLVQAAVAAGWQVIAKAGMRSIPSSFTSPP